MRRSRFLRAFSALMFTLLIVSVLKLDQYGGWFAARALLRGKGSLWYTIEAGHEQNPEWLNLAMVAPSITARPGKFTMGPIEAGADAGELQVLVGGREVDRIYLLRFSQDSFSAVVGNDPRGGKQTDEWLDSMRASAVVNGSYYAHDRFPATPTISNGQVLGPREYSATHGAFVVRERTANIVDLRASDWRPYFKGASQAFVSYPLLISQGKSVPNKAHPQWLANRSFIAIDDHDRIVLGTTDTGYFSLPNLARFLGDTPLGLVSALNLDGGPVACQAARFKTFSRDFCGEWEVATRGSEFKSLKPVVSGARWDLPIAIGIVKR